MVTAPHTAVNLLDFDDSPAIIHQQPQQAVLPTGIVLQPSFEMSPPQFQQYWTQVPDAFNGKLCQLQRAPTEKSDIELAVRQYHVCIAILSLTL